MVRSDRRDTEGSWHHVVNRGLARRTLFEDRTDYRRFLAWIARASRRGLVEVHAYSLLPNHLHLLAEVIPAASVTPWLSSRRSMPARSTAAVAVTVPSSADDSIPARSSPRSIGGQSSVCNWGTAPFAHSPADPGGVRTRRSRAPGGA